MISVYLSDPSIVICVTYEVECATYVDHILFLMHYVLLHSSVCSSPFFDICYLILVMPNFRGISDEALQLSDLHCCIPMNGMVDSFNVSVAAGILMHHAVCDRVSRLVMPLHSFPVMFSNQMWQEFTP